MVVKDVGNYKLKTVSNAEMNELSSLIEKGLENGKEDRVRHFFHSLILKYPDGRTLVFYFPRERYFVSRLGEENYLTAFLQYIGYLKC